MTSTEQYPYYVASKSKPGKHILESLTAEKCERLHMAVGLMGEVVELTTALGVGTVSSYTETTKHHIFIESGDVEFYLAGLNNLYGNKLSRGNILLIFDHSILINCAGTILELMKKHVIYNKPAIKSEIIRHSQNLADQLDTLYTALTITHEEIQHLNILKLNARYESGYTDEEARERKDYEPQHI